MEIGDIVYWVQNRGNNFDVKYGMISDLYPGCVCVDYLTSKEDRLIDGVPLEHFKSETKWRKLPKGWTYNTELFKIEHRIFPAYKNLFIDIAKPESIKEAFNRGALVKDSEKFWGNIEAEIDKNAGFRIVKKYPMWQHHVSSTTLRNDEVYENYEDAKNKELALVAEFERQCNLTDEEWSIEQIEKDIRRWQHFMDASNEETDKIRGFFAELKDIVDVETRISGGFLQWKYWKRKKWNTLDPNDLDDFKGDYKGWANFLTKSQGLTET